MKIFGLAICSSFTLAALPVIGQVDSDLSASCRLLSRTQLAPEALGFSEDEAFSFVEQILEPLGLQPNFQVLAVISIDGMVVHNAAAVMLRRDDETGLGSPYIVYNPEWIEREIRSDRWKAVGLIAHEIGHHLQQHTLTCSGSDHRKEIEADEFAGRALARFGASLTEALSLWQGFSESGSRTHPPRADRLAAVERGWSGLSSNELPGGRESNGFNYVPPPPPMALGDLPELDI